MHNFLQNIPPEIFQITLVLLFSFSLGLAQHKRYPQKRELKTFGTDRTFSLIGLWGFLLLVATPETKIPYLIGLGILGVLLSIFYILKAPKEHLGITSIVLGLITYSFPLLIQQSPYWLSLLLFVIVLLFTEMKEPLNNFNKKLAKDELSTLAKFIIMAGVILPLLPKDDIADFLPVSPYKVWLAVVVVSAISYLSYLLRKYVFPQAGLLLTGILGGLYSSTASTVILAQKSKEDSDNHGKAYAGTIIIATAMMFFRIYILLLIFNYAIAIITLPYFIGMFLVSLTTGILLYRSNGTATVKTTFEDKNPLELKVAIVFSVLYIVFSAITEYMVNSFGANGLNILSVIVGVTDIDPFLLNLFQGHYNVAPLVIGIATLQATASNSVLKGIYAWILGGEKMRKYSTLGFLIVLIANLLVVGTLYIL